MLPFSIIPYGSAAHIITPGRGGWHKITDDIGVEVITRVGVQFRTKRGGWYTITMEGWGTHAGYLPPRAILTIRHDSPQPTLGLLRPYGDPSDYSGGGGQGIDACGAPGTVHDHDSVMQRCPVGLYDMATGKLRAIGTIAVAGYYRGTRGWPYNKVTQPPDYCVWMTADKYDDRRNAADATPIPAYGLDLRARVLAFQAYDLQHFIRAFRFGLRIPHDKFVQADLRALLRDAELAWDKSRTDAIWSMTGGLGNSNIGREFAWVLYLAAVVERMDNRLVAKARDLLGLGFASRLRKVARHVAHVETGILQRFVEGMSASPYPYGPAPASGVPVGAGIGLTQHLEACAQIVALEAAGMKRETLKLARTILLAKRRLKWINTDTGNAEGGGWHGPAEDQAWPAIGVLLRLDRRAGILAALGHKVVGDSGNWIGPFLTLDYVLAALQASPEKGKNAWAIAELEKRRVL